MTYEGARSITGPYLGLLGASAAVVGVVAGLGELLGYSLRLVSGYLSDRTRQYWGFTFVGYAVNLLAVPLLALAGRWEVAAALIVAERIGKAIRTPARDAMLSHATSRIGRGWGFGVHEALDQIGAILGPMVVAAVLYLGGGYRLSFAALLVPALFALTVLTVARNLNPRPQALEISAGAMQPGGLARAFWLYLIAMAFVAAGVADFPLIAFHFGKAGVVPEVWIPIFYAVAMGVDALAALGLGRVYDRLGLKVLLIVVVLSALAVPMVFLGRFHGALFGVALWGASIGAQESIMRAAVAGMVSRDKRGTAYGIFNTGFGIAWFLGSALLGILYDVSLPSMVAFSVVTQLLSIPLLVAVIRMSPASQ
ncbi:MAG: MFS transporter [Anaerolineae bacterium]|nr:MFS transporter [Anaerolineae bacterium]MDW8102557.1 MFS transporter [Anaerolineae bacterium]